MEALAVHGARAPLAPDIVEAILDGRQLAGMTLAALMRPFAVGWAQQNRTFRAF